MIKIVRIVEQKSGKVGTTALVTHFCREKDVSTGGGPEMVIQHLIFQLLRIHKPKFNDTQLCQREGLTRSGFQAVANHQDKLWNIFKRCGNLAKIQSLVIMLDSVEAMYRATTPTTFEEFVRGLQSFLVTAQKGGIVVKVMVTSMVPAVRAYFSQDQNSSIIQLPKPPPRPGQLTT
jgi:hypothetical protein